MKLWFERGAWASKKGHQTVTQLNNQNIQKIAVIRHAALGDMVITRPFLIALREVFPKAEITLSLVSNYQYGAPIDLVDHVYITLGSDKRDAKLRDKLQSITSLGRQDIIFDLASTPRSQWVLALNKTMLKVGFPYRSYQRHLFYDIAIQRSDFKFEAETLFDMLHIFGQRIDHNLNYAMKKWELSNNHQYIVYFPSASTPDKCWPDEYFSNLIRKMAKKHPNIQHIVLQGVSEHEDISGIIQPLQDIPNVEGKMPMSLADTEDFLIDSLMLVSNDTGIRNLAIAMQVPTLGIFYSTIPFRYWPNNDRHEVVYEMNGDIPSVDNVYTACDVHAEHCIHKLNNNE